MSAPAVDEASETLTGAENDPPGGLIDGVATVGSEMTIDATATVLSPMPLANARALTVLDEEIENEPEYSVDALVGVVPSVVKRIVAPDVAVANETCTGALNVPPFGLMVGVAAEGGI